MTCNRSPNAASQPECRLILSDISERKRLEAQLLRAQRMESLGSLSSGIAHDMNNILAPVLMAVPILRDEVSDPDSKLMLDAMETGAQRGSSIIKQLLTYARGTPGARLPLPVRLLQCELSTIIRETFPRNIQASVLIPQNLWPVLGDVTQLHQVLLNLCVNARDAMPEGGTLTLAACNVTLDRTVALLPPEVQPGPYVCVSVSDTGTGIPPEVLERVFDPFFTTKEFGKGTGLGLSTVQGVMRGHGGFVRVDTCLGRGTTFELYFPATPEAKVAEDAVRPPPPAGHGELILVVDDEASMRDTLRIGLKHHGYRVLTAENGAEGLAVFTQHRAEVRAVLTDIMMPVMNGTAMITALRAQAPTLPILGMTGLLEGVKGIEDLKLEAWLRKPFTIADLLHALHAALHPKP